MPEPKKPHRLKNLRLEFVSGVDAGSSPGAQVMLMRRQAGEEPEPVEKGGGPVSLKDRLVGWITATRKGLDDLMKEVGADDQQQTTEKGRGDPMPEDPKGKETTEVKSYEDVLKTLPEEQRKLVEAQIAEAKKAAEDKPKDDVEKAKEEKDDKDQLTVELAKRDELIKKLREDLDAERLERRRANLRQEVVKFDRLGKSTNELATMLEKAENADPELAKSLREMWAGEQARAVDAGLFQEIGKSSDEVPSVSDLIKKKADEFMKADSNLKRSDAIRMATTDPEVAKAYEREAAG